MQRLVLVKGNHLEEINRALTYGWRIVSVHPVAEHISGEGYGNLGSIYAYVVIEKADQ